MKSFLKVGNALSMADAYANFRACFKLGASSRKTGRLRSNDY